MPIYLREIDLMVSLLSLRYSETTALLLAMMTIQLLSYIGWGVYVTQDESYRQFVNVGTIRQVSQFYGISIVISLVWLGVCLHYRRATVRTQRLLVIGGLSIFMSVMMCAAWVSGLFTLAVGAILAGSPFIGIILFPIGVVLISTGLAWLAFIVLTTATLAGDLAYAPIFKEKMISHSVAYAEFYFFSQIYFVLPFLMLTVAVSAVYLRQSKHRDAKILHLSQTDYLTQIYNRRTAHDVLTRLMTDCTAQPVSVVLIDLDFFKSINDLYGHLVGDRVLVTVAAVLRDSIRQHDWVARFGGEEFVLILERTDSTLAAEIAERGRQQICDCVVLSDDQQKISLSASFGVACAVPSATTNLVDQLLRQADQALYQAKSNGRNQVVVYQDPDIAKVKVTDGLKTQTN